jgi:hypothetical protein
VTAIVITRAGSQICRALHFWHFRSALYFPFILNS